MKSLLMRYVLWIRLLPVNYLVRRVLQNCVDLARELCVMNLLLQIQIILFTVLK